MRKLNEIMQKAYYNEWKKIMMNEGHELNEIRYLYINSGANFVDKFTCDYVRKRLNKKNKYEMMDKDSLFTSFVKSGNSSQAMTFNLFCPFIEMMENGDGENVNSIFRSIFPNLLISKVTRIELEFFPIHMIEQLFETGAMDAIVWFDDIDGQKGFIAFEVKYSEDFNTRTPKNNNFKKCITNIHAFKDEYESELINETQSATQLYRNYTLSESYALAGGFGKHISIVLALQQHPNVAENIRSFKMKLRPEKENSISFIPLQYFLEKVLIVCCEEYKALFEKFLDRYLNISKLCKTERGKKIYELYEKRFELSKNTCDFPKVRAFAHFSNDKLIRWREFIQIGNATEIIGAIFLYRPNKRKPGHRITTENLNSFFDDGIEFYEFEKADTQESIIRLFYERFCLQNRTCNFEGIIQVFYLINNIPNQEHPIHKAEKLVKLPSFAVSKDIDHLLFPSHRKEISTTFPVYLGWGRIPKQNPLRANAQKIFNMVVKSSDYLRENFDDNSFFKPTELMDKLKFDENLLETRYRFVTGLTIP